MTTKNYQITRFVSESNMIEGIRRPPTDEEIMAHELFLSLKEITIESLENFVSIVAPHARLRDKTGLDVRVGTHVAPTGGMRIRVMLQMLLDDINTDKPNSYKAHCEYETLHPFSDGNGRSGRAIWAWQECRRLSLGSALRLGFLHSWYYSSLQNCQVRS